MRGEKKLEVIKIDQILLIGKNSGEKMLDKVSQLS